MKKVEKPKKPLIFYYLIALIILVLLNTFLFPNILGKNIRKKKSIMELFLLWSREKKYQK